MRKMLTEIRETTAQGKTARVNDLRVRQDQPDEWRVHPIVGQLIDKVGSVSTTLYARALKILVSQLASGIRVKRQYVFGVSSGLAQKRRDVLKLGRTFHQAMARQYLLDERRTGARQADNKDRVGRVASTLALGKSFAGECLDAPV